MRDGSGLYSSDCSGENGVSVDYMLHPSLQLVEVETESLDINQWDVVGQNDNPITRL